MLKDRVIEEFTARFGAAPAFVVRAPGRVNLIGEHTDYNDGFVLPMAIEREVCIALRPRSDDTVSVKSLDFDEEATFSLNDLARGENGWIEYIKGSAWALQQEGAYVKGWEGVLAGDVPLGAGLSSSAALELAALRAFAAASHIQWDSTQMALLGQKAENEWVGVNCGIMDQLISAAGQNGHALLIDCRSLELQAVPLPDDVVVVILDTSTRRGLVDSAYNERRRQCEAAARTFGVPALRDIDSGTLEQRAAELDEATLRRARHVVTENERTIQAAEAMRDGDAGRLGQLMDASHVSLRDDFEVSSKALDLIVELARLQEACLGARMTGAGFGGCAVALVESAEAEEFAAEMRRSYVRESGRRPSVYVTGACSGAGLLHVDETASAEGGEVASADRGD